MGQDYSDRTTPEMTKETRAEIDRLQSRLREAGEKISALEASMEIQEALLSTALATSAEGVIAVDRQGRLLRSNPQAGRILREEPAAWENGAGPFSAYQFFAGDAAASLPLSQTPLEKARRGEDVPRGEVYIRRPDGSGVRVNLSAHPLKDAQGRLLGALARIEETGEAAAIARDAAQRELLIDQLARERDKLLTLIQSLEDEVWFFDAAGRLILINPAVVRNLGFDPFQENLTTLTEIVGRLHWATQDGRQPGVDEAPVVRALRGERIKDEEEVLFHPATGSRIYRQLNAVPLYAGGDGILGVVVVVRDMTARKQAEEALQRANEDLESRVRERTWQLQESEARYRQVIKNVKDYAIFTLDPEGRIQSWNAGAEAIKGYQASEILGENYAKFFPADVAAAGVPRIALERAAELGRFETEGWRVRKDGTRFWSNSVITPIYHEETGELIGFAKISRDMTRRKEADEALRRQTGFVHLQQEVASAANQAAVAEDAIRFALAEVCRHGGWSAGHMLALSEEDREEMVSTSIWYLTDSERFAEFRQVTEGARFRAGVGLPGMVMQSEEPLWVEDMTQERNSIRREWAERAGIRAYVAMPVLAGDKVVGVMEFFSDQVKPPDLPLKDVLGFIGTQLGRVVERQESERALRESEARFRTIFEGAPTGIEMVDLNGGLLAWNPAIEQILGYSAEQMAAMARQSRANPANVITNTAAAQDTRPLEPLAAPISLKSRLGGALFDRLRRGEISSYRLEQPYRKADGGQLWGRLSVSLVRDAADRPLSAIGILEDDTERKQLEADLAELKRRQIEGREEERLHLSQELHDGPVQDLIGLAFHLKAFSDTLPPSVEPEPLAEVRREMQTVVRTLRTICGELRPPTLAPFGLEKAIRSHAAEFQQDYPDIEIGLDLMPDGQAMPENQRLALFRIYQQALTNIRRHANARHVLVRLVLDDESVILAIKDDGKGFAVPDRWIDLAREGHLGLLGAFERAESIGGTLSILSTPGMGTTIQVNAPRRRLSEQFSG